MVLGSCDSQVKTKTPQPETNVAPNLEKYNQAPLRRIDSIAFRDAWIKFARSIINKDSNYIKEKSFAKVSCLNCNTPNDTDLNFCVPIATFIHDAFKWGEEKWFRSAISSGEFYFSGRVSESYFSCANSRLLVSDIYEVSFVTLKPNELEPGHEGAGAAYKFIKQNGKFLFFQMFTVP